MPRTKQARSKKAKAKSFGGLMDITAVRPREPNGRLSRKAEPRKLEPLPEQVALRERNLKGGAGDPNDPLAVAQAQGWLSEHQADAMRRFRRCAQEFARVVRSPRSAPDILGTLQPQGGGSGVEDEERERRARAAYAACILAMNPAPRRMAEEAITMVSESMVGKTVTQRQCERIQYPADLLAGHFGLFREAA